MHMQNFKVKKKSPCIVSRPAKEKNCVVDYSRNEIYNCWPMLPTFAINLKHKRLQCCPFALNVTLLTQANAKCKP